VKKQSYVNIIPGSKDSFVSYGTITLALVAEQFTTLTIV